MAEGDSWAQLVCVSEEDGLVIPISSDVFSIGRAKACDLSMPDNKLISGKHCCLRRIGPKKTIWLEDTSTNGTWLNGVKVGKGQKQRLCHKDEIAIVYQQGGKSDQNIVYRFDDYAVIEAENENLDQTQVADTDENTEDYLFEDIEEKDVSRKRKNRNVQEEEEEEPTAKKPVMEDEEPEKCEEKADKDDGEKEEKPDRDVKGENPEENAKSNAADESDTKTTDEDTKKVPDTDEKAETTGEGGGGEQGAAGGGGGQQEEKTDDIFETLICSICQDILHNCISLQPCMHSFCAACYSGWKKHSNKCPQCRKVARRAGHNYIVNSLVDAYLKQHPEKKRSKEELEEMDAQNDIPINQQFSYDGGEEDEDYDDDEDYEGSDLSDGEEREDYMPPQPPPCRQCAHYVQPLNRNFITVVSSRLSCDKASTSGTTGAAASTSDAGASSAANRNTRVATGGVVIPMPTPPQFQCDARYPVHLACLCCYELMPDRRGDRQQNPNGVPPQTCSVCVRNFCHMYWGCWKQNCCGCLSKFKDMKFNQNVLDNIVNGNTYESSMFKDILKSKSITTIEAVLKQCMEKLTNGEFSTPETQRHNLTAESPMCYTCGLKIFQQLGYQLRAAVPADELPAILKARPACHWGKNCRTQFNKPRHAVQFNHICEQTRF